MGQTAEVGDRDWKVERKDNNKFAITDLATSQTSEVDLASFNYEHNSLIKMVASGPMGAQTFQLVSCENDINFNFYFQGGKVETRVYDEA